MSLLMKCPSLGLTLAKNFLCYHESNSLEYCSKGFQPVYYQRYMDDIFVLFNKLNHSKFFLEYVHKKQKKNQIFN